MTIPQAPHALVETGSPEFDDLWNIGWRPTNRQNGWARMEPPVPSIKIPSISELLAQWRPVGAGLGPTCWALESPEDPLDDKVGVITAGSTLPRKPFIAYGRLDGGAAACLAHGSLEEAVKALRDHLGLG